MSNPGDRYTRCKSQHCRNRCAAGETFCGEHGGAPYIRKDAPDEEARKSRFHPSFAFAVDDLTCHLVRCEHCRTLDIDTPPWLWDSVYRQFLGPQLCKHGQHLMARLESAHCDHRIVMPLYIQRRTREANRAISILMAHIKTCPTCREHRPINRPVWEWTAVEFDQFSAVCCTVGLNLTRVWESYDQTINAAA